ncbi:DUF2933 domain-containing protein [Mesorhizobium sp. M7A.F.Ca.US.010.02.1.1]|uniref:DUF2933 domain-containing protein n=1 Tax=Mesorhizobium sp. M7A.F.Ca.US.010.02.1.1 TaxID=2496743 RepID=UPI001FDF6999|nr:DUF2933 domain-containing protein [Mesorhizobium sp. M7A.F.Ca.US.010.02.1.1]
MSDPPTGSGPEPETEAGGFWTSKAGLATIAFLLIAAFFLLTEHRAHTLGVLPFLLLLACPLLHMFMHGGHRGHGGHGGHARHKEPEPDAQDGTTHHKGA